MSSVLKSIPEPLRRLAVVGVVGSVVTMAVIYSRAEHIVLDDALLASKQVFVQPKDRQQAQGWFTPTPNATVFADAQAKGRQQAASAPTPRATNIADARAAEIGNTITLPRPRPTSPWVYYELVRAQGDGEGEYVLVEKKCVPNVDMPQQCYLPEQGRRNFPVRRQ
jgi:hypothetical protein